MIAAVVIILGANAPERRNHVGYSCFAMTTMTIVIVLATLGLIQAISDLKR